MFLLNFLTWILALTVFVSLLFSLDIARNLKSRVFYFIMALMTLMTDIMLLDIMGVIKLW